jgi:hypothetical protein
VVEVVPVTVPRKQPRIVVLNRFTPSDFWASEAIQSSGVQLDSKLPHFHAAHGIAVKIRLVERGEFSR